MATTTPLMQSIFLLDHASTLSEWRAAPVPQCDLAPAMLFIGYQSGNSVTTANFRIVVVSEETTADFQPRTELGKRLLALRREYLARGGFLLSPEELDAEMRDRRGGLNDD